MKLTDFSVKNYQFTLVIFLMIIAVGVSTLLTMPRSEDPELHAPQFPVVIIYPGASPEDLEDLVIDPLEEKITSLEDIKEVRSSISDGVAVINVEYKYESDVDDKYQELTREVNTLQNTLPMGIQRIEVQKISPSNVNVLQLGLVSENTSLESLRKHAEALEDRLESLPMLKEIEISGLPDRTVRIDLSLEKMAQMHIPLNRVTAAVQSEMADLPGGSVEAGERSLNVLTGEKYTSPEAISNIIVYAAEGKNVRLGDIAHVHYDHAEQTHITRLNGYRSLFITAALKPGYNISEAQKQYKPLIEDYESALPSNIALVLHFDQADNVHKRLGMLGRDFLIAICLVAITLLPLGNRASLIVMISIPLSLAIGLILLNLLGYTLNQLSIVGLVVALGLLVDDSIVVVENIERWIREGHSRMEAALKATGQIGTAIIGCTIILIIAFLPIAFMPEAAGEFIRGLPIAVMMCVLASMLVSLTVIPFLSSKILKKQAGEGHGNVFLQTLQKGIQITYAPLLNRALKKPVITLLIAGGLFAGALYLFPVLGFTLFPPSEKPQFMIDISAPFQTSIYRTDEISRDVEKVLAAQPRVKYFATNVGKGNPQVYYNVIQENEHTDFAQIFVQLDEDVNSGEKIGIIENLRREFSHYPGAKIEVKNFEQGPPVLAPVEVRLMGNNLDTLRSLAGRVERLLKHTAGTMYVDNPVSNLKSDVKVQVNTEKAGLLGVAAADIDRTIRTAVSGMPAGRYSDDNGKEHLVVITTPRVERASMHTFDDIYINNLQGRAIPLSQIAGLELEASPVFIRHLNKIRYMTVSAFVQKGYLDNQVIAKVTGEMDQLELPPGYSYTMAGAAEAQSESFAGFGTIILATIFLFIAVLVLEFKTFKSTLIVLSVIPLGMVGAVLALLATGHPVSFVAIIGMIALAGIEVKNSILLVDFTNQLRQQGKSLDEAIKEAGEVRFLPIILTAMTAIGGLTPIALSSNPLISPLAIVIIGGLISSTLLSRVVTPVLYKLLPPKIHAG